MKKRINQIEEMKKIEREIHGERRTRYSKITKIK